MALASLQSTREAFAARQTTIATALLLLLTSFGLTAIERAQHGNIQWAYLAQGLIATVVAFLLWRARSVSTRWSLVAFVVLVLPVFPILWSFESPAVPTGAQWHPFTGAKLILLGLAVLTPSPLLALVLLTLLMAEWALLLHRSGLSFTLSTGDDAGEPWMTLLYFAAALLLVGSRWRNLRLERHLTATELEAQTLREVKQISTAIRDQLSTPLQNLELSIAALRGRHPEEEKTLERMSRALEKLVELRPLSEHSAEIARLRMLRVAGERLEHRTEAVD